MGARVKHYPHHIGDFNQATRHLTRLERSVYRDLIDLYYDTEQQLPLDVKWICRKILANSNEESTAVEQTLNEFFTETPTGWYHERCEAEIEHYRANASQKAIAGRASAAAKAAKKQRALNGKSTDVATPVEQTNNGVSTNQNQEPVTKNHIPPKPPKVEPDGFEEFYSAYPRKEARAAAAKAFAKVKEPVSTLLTALAWQRERNEWKKDGGQFIPLPASWLNAERWKDEKPAFQPGDTLAWYETKNGVEKKAISMGMAKHNEAEEQFPAYRARVMTAAREKAPGFALNLDQLAGMAKQRQGASA